MFAHIAGQAKNKQVFVFWCQRVRLKDIKIKRARMKHALSQPVSGDAYCNASSVRLMRSSCAALDSMSGDGDDGMLHRSELGEVQCRDRMKSCPMLLVLCLGKSQPLHPFSYLTFTLDASRQRSTPSCIYIYASLRKLLIVSVQSKSKRDATGFDLIACPLPPSKESRKAFPNKERT